MESWAQNASKSSRLAQTIWAPLPTLTPASPSTCPLKVADSPKASSGQHHPH